MLMQVFLFRSVLYPFFPVPNQFLSQSPSIARVPVSLSSKVVPDPGEKKLHRYSTLLLLLCCAVLCLLDANQDVNCNKARKAKHHPVCHKKKLQIATTNGPTEASIQPRLHVHPPLYLVVAVCKSAKKMNRRQGGK